MKPPMKTLIRIVKCLNGYETWYRVEGTDRIEIRFTPRTHKRGK